MQLIFHSFLLKYHNFTQWNIHTKEQILRRGSKWFIKVKIINLNLITITLHSVLLLFG